MLRTAAPGIATGVMLAVARVTGETAPLLFTSLNSSAWSNGLNEPTASLPVTIYNVLVHNPVTPDITRRLAEIGAIVATKESVGGSLATLSELLDTVPDLISVTWAQDHLLYSGLALGATGSISGTGAMFAGESVAMFEAIKRNDYDEAKRIHFALAPITRAVMNGKNWPAWVKAVATLQGRKVGPARLPFIPLTDDEMALLEAGLKVAKTALPAHWSRASSSDWCDGGRSDSPCLRRGVGGSLGASR